MCLPFASWRLGLARRTGPNVRRRRSNAPTREGRRGPGLGGSCGGAGAGQVGGSGVATSRFARSSWFEAGFRSGHLSAVRSRPGRRASARPSGYASRYGADVHAAGLFVSLSV